MLKSEVRELIKQIKENLTLRYGHERVLDLLTKENRRLREENKRLVINNERILDRLMARDFESYATYKEEEPMQPYFIDSKNEPLLDETNTGEVIEE